MRLCSLLLKIWVLPDMHTHTHTHPSETGSRCRGTTPSHATYTWPHGLATKNNIRLYYSFTTGWKRGKRDGRVRDRASERETDSIKRYTNSCLRFQLRFGSTGHTVRLWPVVVPMNRQWSPQAVSIIIVNQNINFSTMLISYLWN